MDGELEDRSPKSQQEKLYWIKKQSTKNSLYSQATCQVCLGPIFGVKYILSYQPAASSGNFKFVKILQTLE